MKPFVLAILAGAPFLAGCQTVPVDNDAVESRVESALQDNEFLDRFDIRAQHSGGKVTLTGKVDNEYQSYLAGTLAKGIEGVKSVDNDIRID